MRRGKLAITRQHRLSGLKPIMKPVSVRCAQSISAGCFGVSIDILFLFVDLTFKSIDSLTACIALMVTGSLTIRVAFTTIDRLIARAALAIIGSSTILTIFTFT
ncbi:hypothetical protein [Pusillimonas sp. ANT_WB101]|uniref:hypothetical protein n=1 Tax=Pusillimonas sp. ANT_WB101 TaxID=2597356 RepID=UPI0011EC96C8|nr:hypothetical protein [Pusillimonas sp. ANT_WB101]KAA0910559.1 hypothetical protein FQ179_01375 [Pusillimonas sp. ANT_WB101]